MPRMDGVALLKALSARGDRTPTIVLTGFGSVDQAISFVHELKASWFLEKPVQSGVLRTLLERAIQQNQLIEETERLNRQLSYGGVLGDLHGDSPAICRKSELHAPVFSDRGTHAGENSLRTLSELSWLAAGFSAGTNIRYHAGPQRRLAHDFIVGNGTNVSAKQAMVLPTGPVRAARV